MEAADILEKARAGGEHPPDWVILPLLRNKVMLGIAGWALGAIVGLGLFAAMVPIMIPHNYSYGFIAALFSTLVLGLMLFVGVGSIWQIIVDTSRLLQADKHVIVITPEDFVMQKGGKIIHVPLMYVRHITARGTPPPDRTAPTDAVVSDMPHSSENLTSFIFGRGLIPSGRRMFSRRKRVPTLLAFVDSRTNTQVKVTDNNSYGDPLKIASILRENTTRVQHIV